jgi:hypothetical protein
VKPNWPLVGIMSAAVVTLGVVVTIFVTSTPSGPAIATVPTVAQLDGAHDAWSTPLDGVVVERNDCLFATVQGVERFVVWPDGYVKDGSGVRSEEGDAVSVGDRVAGTGTLLSRADALAASDAYSQYLGDMTGRCLGDGAKAAGAIVVFSTLTMP